jgi:hypothetical protein
MREGINQYCSIFVLSGVRVWWGMKGGGVGGHFCCLLAQKSKRKDATRGTDTVAATGAPRSRSPLPPPQAPLPAVAASHFRCFILKRNINAH